MQGPCQPLFGVWLFDSGFGSISQSGTYYWKVQQFVGQVELPLISALKLVRTTRRWEICGHVDFMFLSALQVVRATGRYLFLGAVRTTTTTTTTVTTATTITTTTTVIFCSKWLLVPSDDQEERTPAFGHG